MPLTTSKGQAAPSSWLRAASIWSGVIAAAFLGPNLRAKDCTDTSEGPACRTQQPIRAGWDVPTGTQRSLGLVTVNGGCSGTLLNRYWVLTARHCVTVDGEITTALRPSRDITITGTWATDRVGQVTKVYEFAVNRAMFSPRDRDAVLLFLGASDLGPVNSQRIYMTLIYGPNNSVRLSGRLTTNDTVTQYGRGYSTFATGVWGGTPPAVAATGLGDYRSAQFRPSNIGDTHYRLNMNTNTPLGQVGHGGDSGGPSVVTVNGNGVGIAGIQTTCRESGYVPNLSPAREDWMWATGILWCTYVATEPLATEITSVTRETPPVAGTLFQRHVDGRIWKYDGYNRCTGTACPGWVEIDHNPRTAEIVTARGTVFQRHVDGRIWMYDGKGVCNPSACPGWTEIDRNARTAVITGGSNGFFQMHVDGRIWKYDGTGRCTATACPGWTEIDRNTRTREIVQALGTLFQRHVDGRLWKYNGSGRCTSSACPGWTEIDRNPATVAITGGSDGFYQRHSDGKIWKYDGVSRCTTTACRGWLEIDHNPRTASILASGGSLFQLHVDGRIWKYDGQGYCTPTACPGWHEIDRNPRTAAITAGGAALYQRHVDGRIWKYDGQGFCIATACPGWIEIDRNARTESIVAVEPF
jgi:hypothetical protein